MATGNGVQRDKSNGTDNQSNNKGAGSPRIQGSWSVKHNPKMEKVNSKRVGGGK